MSNNQIGTHPLVKRFCKGTAVVHPPRPRYDYVWDPQPVVARLAKTYPHEGLSLEVLTKKLALLLTLATGQRLQTLALMKITEITLSDKLIIRVPDRIKTSAPGRAQPFFTFTCFAQRESLCIYHLVKLYLELTKPIRPDGVVNLFVAVRKPHKGVGTQTLSRWIREGLAQAGVSMESFGAHSTRHASTSLAAKKGVSIDLIKKSACWSGDSQVFANFYNRPIVNPESFSNAVLS